MIGRSRAGRKIQPGWWVHTGGTVNPETAEVTHDPKWLEVVGKEVYDEVFGRRRYTVHELLLSDGSILRPTASEPVQTLRPAEACEHGLVPAGAGQVAVPSMP